jgi:hypothetical protein
MATLSSEILIDGLSFVTKTEGDTATVVRTATGKSITQIEKETAGIHYDAVNNEIDYAKIYNLDFGSNFLSKLGASDDWMVKAASSKQYKDAFKKATGKNSSNISFAFPETSDIFETLTNDVDANGSSTVNRGGSILRYPLNEDKKNYDYLKVCAYEYKPRGFGTGARQGLTGDYEDKGLQRKQGNHTVFLPMEPTGLQEGNSVGWGDDTINAIEAGAANITGSTITGAAQGMEQAAKGFAGATGKATKEILGGLGEGEEATRKIAAFFAGQAVGKNVFTRATGQVMNNNLELLFTGPSLRQFAYSFRFTPREETEAKEVRRIIKLFKKAMAPKKGKQKMFLESPHVFKLKYYFKNGQEHPFLNKIKTCALRSFNVQYAPDGSYMTYDDGSMTSYTVNMSFGELNPIYADDIDESSNDMGF